MDEDAPLEAMPGSGHGVSPEPIRRFEILTGVGRRRSFAVDEKLALVAQMEGCANISALARRHDLRPSQLFTWRRELRYAVEAVQVAVPEPMFVPAVIAPGPVAAAAAPLPGKKRVERSRSAAAVELIIDGVAVKIARGADAGVIAAVIDALKSPR